MDKEVLEQQNKLKSWAIRRDEILQEISKLNIEKEAIITANGGGNTAFSEVQNRIFLAIGRLDEIDRLEQQKKNSISLEISKLTIEKSVLEKDIEGKKIQINELNAHFNVLNQTIDTLSGIHAKVFDKTSVMEEMTGHVTRISQQNMTDLDVYFTKLKASIQEIVDKNSKNVEQTNIVLSKIHKYIFELQKPIPVRRIPGK